MVIYEKNFCEAQNAYIISAVFNGTCASFSSTDEYAPGSMCICNDGIMIKYSASTWSKYTG